MKLVGIYVWSGRHFVCCLFKQWFNFWGFWQLAKIPNDGNLLHMW